MQAGRGAVQFCLGSLAGAGAVVGYWRINAVVEEESAAEPGERFCKYGLPEPSISAHTYTSHTLAYDRSRRVPVWVQERVSRDHVVGNVANRKRSNFQPDSSLPAPFTSTNQDYRGSGWSRGHMAPAADFKHCQTSMNDTFFLTNIVPQNYHNNSGYWNRLEMYCRDLTKRHDEVSITSGPLFLPEKDDKSGKRFVKYEVIGENSVAVPTHLFKIILAERRGEPATLGVFIVPNKPLGDVNLTRFQVTLEELESHTGTTFHSSLDRSKVSDLCVTDSCKLMSVEKQALFMYNKRMQSARNSEQLEKLWQEMKKEGLQPDDVLKQTYMKRKLELQTKQ